MLLSGQRADAVVGIGTPPRITPDLPYGPSFRFTAPCENRAPLYACTACNQQQCQATTLRWETLIVAVVMVVLARSVRACRCCCARWQCRERR